MAHNVLTHSYSCSLVPGYSLETRTICYWPLHLTVFISAFISTRSRSVEKPSLPALSSVPSTLSPQPCANTGYQTTLLVLIRLAKHSGSISSKDQLSPLKLKSSQLKLRSNCIPSGLLPGDSQEAGVPHHPWRKTPVLVSLPITAKLRQEQELGWGKGIFGSPFQVTVFHCRKSRQKGTEVASHMTSRVKNREQ